MALDGVKNFAIVTVSTTYDASATSIVLTTGHGAKLPDPATANFNLVWWDSSNYADPSSDPNVEIVRCTAKSTDTLTVTRAQEGTGASTKNTGGATYKMILGVTAKMITDIDTLKANLASPTFSGTLTVPTGLTGVLRADSGVVSVDTDVTDIVAAASTTVAGIAEIATGAEVITGTDDVRAVSPKAVTDSDIHTFKNTRLDVYTKSLLHFDGVDASTTMTDESGKIWTANGNAQIDTAQSKFGGASLLLDGTGDYIDTPDDVDFTVGSGNFTVEAWVRRATTGRMYILGQSDNAGTTASVSIWITFDVNNKINGGVASTTNSYTIIKASANTDSDWHHIALVRYSNTLSLYVDGESVGTPIDLTGLTINDSSYKFSIGRLGEYASYLFNGWIDEFRFSNGIARYTANFTPSTKQFDNLIIPSTIATYLIPQSNILRVSKTANETVNNSTTYQADEHLTLAVEATTYTFKLYVFGTNANATPGLKLGFFTSTADNFTVSKCSVGNTTTEILDEITLTETTGAGTSGISQTDTTTHWKYAGAGLFKNSGTINFTVACTLTVQWAQSTAHASNTVLNKGSYLELIKI